MYYDDTVRRFNFLAGLGFGAVLGVGLAMLAAPQKKVRRRRRLRALSSVPEAIPAEVMERLRSGWRRR
jgi:gas vesicle protein